MKNEKLIELAECFISQKDEYADIIVDGMIKEGAKFLSDFIVYLYESGYEFSVLESQEIE